MEDYKSITDCLKLDKILLMNNVKLVLEIFIKILFLNSKALNQKKKKN